MYKLFLVIGIFLISVVSVNAEILDISLEDKARVSYANLQAQNVQLTAIANALFKKTGCTFKEGQIICPDPVKEKNEKATP